MQTLNGSTPSFGDGKLRCPRCQAHNDSNARECESCFIQLIPVRQEVLRDNQWEARPDEFAVCFSASKLDGFLRKDVVIPPGSRALIIRRGRNEPVGAQGPTPEFASGSYTVQTVMDRLKNLIGIQTPVMIFVTRAAAVPIDFDLKDGLRTSDYLPLSATIRLNLQVVDVHGFAGAFFGPEGGGIVQTAEVRARVAPAIRQAMAEFLDARTIDALAGAGSLKLRDEFQAHLRLALRESLAVLGLALAGGGGELVGLRNDKVDANRALIGQLWLVRDERAIRQEHDKKLGELYDQADRDKIASERRAMERRFMRGELHEDEQDQDLDLRRRAIQSLDGFLNADQEEARLRTTHRGVLEDLAFEAEKKGFERDKALSDLGLLRELATSKREHLRNVQQLSLQRRHAAAEHAVEMAQLARDQQRTELLADGQEKQTERNRIEQKKQRLHDIEMAQEQRSHELAEESARNHQRREQAVLDAKAYVDIKSIRSDADLSAAERALKVVTDAGDRAAEKARQVRLEEERSKWEEAQSAWEQKSKDLADQRTHEIVLLTTRQGLSLQAQIATSSNPEVIKTLARLGELEQLRGHPDLAKVWVAQNVPGMIEVLKQAPAAAPAAVAAAPAGGNGQQAMVDLLSELLKGQLSQQQTGSTKDKDLVSQAIAALQATATGVAQAGGANPVPAAQAAPTIFHVASGGGSGHVGAGFCPRCGKGVQSGWSFCTACGSHLS